MKTHLPALLILLLGAFLYFQRREALYPTPIKPALSHLRKAGTSPATLPSQAKATTESAMQLVERFEAELKKQQPALKSEWRLGDMEIEISKWQRLLDWNAEEASAVRRVAKPKFIALAEARSHAGLPAQAYQQRIAEAKMVLAKAMEQALGAVRAEEWQRAQERARQRGEEDAVNAAIRVIEDVVSLSPEQKDRLHEAFTLRAKAEPTAPPNEALVLKVSHDAGILPELEHELVLAKDILTPEQMIQFDLTQEARKKTSQMILETFRHLLGHLSQSTKL